MPINERTREAEDSFKNQLSKLQSGGSSEIISPNSGNHPSQLVPLEREWLESMALGPCK